MSIGTKKKICIIGGGSSGLVAIKECLAGGLAVDCFEKTDNIGGLWRYREDDVEGLPSVMRSTIINSSKEMSAYSDFPPPDDFPNFMHNSKMVRYFELYAEKFDLLRHVTLNHVVTSVTRAADYDETGEWSVTVRDLKTNEEKTRIYSGVLICTGHHVYPRSPQFPGQELFKGKILHSHSYKRSNGYEDKTVVVLGIGNSAGDIAVELSQCAKQVYLATRRGAWVLNRVGPKGQPVDVVFTTRFFELAAGFAGKDLMLESMLNERFDHQMYNLKPKHRATGQHVVVNDTLPNRIISGTVLAKSSIERFTEDGVVFDGETEVTRCDAVVMATGYKFHFPYFDQDKEPALKVTEDNRIELYKFIFPPSLRHANTLAFVGLVQPIGAIFPIAEMQVRWYVQLMKGSCPALPSFEMMHEDVQKKREQLSKQYFSAPKHTVEVDFIPYMDELAEQFGARPNLTNVFLSGDIALWKVLFFGSAASYQYRLRGPGAWEGARHALLDMERRVMAPFQTRSGALQGEKRSWMKMQLIVLLATLVIGCFYQVMDRASASAERALCWASGRGDQGEQNNEKR